MKSEVEQKMTFTVTPTTELNLQDGSFISKEIVDQWVEATLEKGDYPFYSMAGGSDYSGLGSALTAQLEQAAEIAGSDTDRDTLYFGDTELYLQGTKEAGVLEKITLGGIPRSYETKRAAQRALKQERQQHAFVSYFIAERMMAAAANLTVYRQRQQEAVDAEHSLASARSGL